MTLIDIITELKSTPSRNDKIDVLEKNKEHPGLKEILYATSDPFVTFYMKSLPSIAPTFESEETEDAFNVSFTHARKFVESTQNFDGFIQGTFHHLTNNPLSRQEIYNILYIMGDVLSEQPEYHKLVDDVVSKDLSIGVSTSTINKVFPGLISEFNVMKAEEEAHLDNIVYPAQADLKLDGQMAFAFISRSGDVVIKTSSGREYAKLPTIKKDAEAYINSPFNKHLIDGCVLCGELVAHDKDGNRVERQISNGLASKARTGSISDECESMMKLYVYDVLANVTQLDRGIDGRVLTKRLEDLPLYDKSSSLIPCPSVVVDSKEELMQHFNELVQQGEEGVIVKNLDSIYETVRSKDWIKLKDKKQADVRITGVTSHKKKAGQVGSLRIETEDGKIVGNIGTKLSQKQREELFAMHTEGKLLGHIMTAEFHEVTYSKTKKLHSFYLPRFIELRDDKDEADSFEKVMEM